VTILNAATNGTHWFSVTNRIPSLSWPASFPIRVFKQGAPLVSPASITISNLIGTITNNTEVAVTNAGNDAFTFNITDDAVWDVSYEMTTGTRGSLDFVTAYNAIALNKPTNTFYSSTNAGVSAATSIGFNFPFYGTTYSNFYVTADGYIGLVNAATNIPGISADRTAPLPSKNMTPLIAPFWGTLLSPTGTVRMIRQYDYLVISYTGVSKDGGGTNLQFQAALFTNGCIELRYKNITGITAYGQTNVTIGIQNNAGGPLYEFGGYAHKRHFGAADSANGSVGDLRDADHRHRSAEFRGDQIHC
jgi:hypothetical protein